ncbi:hypothetical protein AGMMS49525_04850 [Bacteroidia bacterium]|nr:hypothetical protein AGMMS49525_04850 [Bacteroidia bacterium]
MKYIEIEKLTPNKDNPRKISLKEIDKLAESLKNNPEYFEARPIICNSELVIYAGHSRYKASKRLGLEKVPVHIMNLPEAKMREIMIRDNVNNGDWDTNILADDWDIDDLTDFGLQFKGGFSSEEESDEQTTTETGGKKKENQGKENNHLSSL